MRLALVYKQFGGSGGLEKYLAAFAHELVNRGHELEVITSKVGEGIPEAKIHHIPPFPVLRTQRLLHFNRAAKAKIEELDVDFVLEASSGRRVGVSCPAVASEGQRA